MHGKKREDGRNFYNFGLEIPDLVCERHKPAVYCVQYRHRVLIALAKPGAVRPNPTAQRCVQYNRAVLRARAF
jgi:hypothetical protein